MNKKYFKEAVDEIHPDKKLKGETLNKITNRRPFRLGLATALISIILVVGIAAFISPKQPQVLNEPKEPKTVAVVEKLPNVGTYENLHKMLKDSIKKSTPTYSFNIKGVDLVADAVQENETMAPSNSKDYSRTNTQVSGVDEADIVKTDGNYIYYISVSKVVIVNAQNPNNLKIEAEISYEKDSQFRPSDIYIDKDKLIVIGYKGGYNSCIKGLCVDYSGPKTEYSVIKIYNTKNKNNLILEREVELEGLCVSSRMIEGNVYLITNKHLYLYDKKEFDKKDEKEFQVKFRDTVASKDVQTVSYDRMYYFPKGEYTTYLNILSVNVNDNKEADVKTYLGAGRQVYCSMNNLYVANELYEYKDYGYYHSSKTDTEINKFKLDGASTSFVAKGTVPGSLLNQFSMDEKNGYFRIATTNRSSFSSENNTCNLYVLDEDLKIVGKVEDLAKGENIYSVRFMGDRAYMVTFKQMDPLFVIDLSNPTTPKVLGELKIPGFSNYLHPYDDTHIIGFGRDTEVEKTQYGERVIEKGMKMALFDVADPNNPKEMFVEKIGKRGTYSELLYNHKALLFSKEKNLIAFPISIKKDNYREAFQGAIVYGLTLENGFKLKGEIGHRGEMKYDYRTNVERIIYIDNTLYTLSNGLIKATDMNTMKELSNVQIEVQDEIYSYDCRLENE